MYKNPEPFKSWTSSVGGKIYRGRLTSTLAYYPTLHSVICIHHELEIRPLQTYRPMPPSIVKLNVGGFKFTTSRSTLCRYPGTFLEVMFSGRHDYPAEVDEEDGSYFIDRDGRHFHHVLNFLRVGHVVSLPDADAARDELAAEADFYGLEGLSRGIQQPQVDILRHLPPLVLKIREEEDKLRRAYSKRQAQLFGSNHGLISLFGGGCKPG